MQVILNPGEDKRSSDLTRTKRRWMECLPINSASHAVRGRPKSVAAFQRVATLQRMAASQRKEPVV